MGAYMGHIVENESSTEQIVPLGSISKEELSILFRIDVGSEQEYNIIAECEIPLYVQRSSIPKHNLVIGRYSVLPFYTELIYDLNSNGSKLINSYTQHRYIADIGNWYRDLEDMTPKTWTDLMQVPDDEFPIVIKGETNSKKFQWKTHMFAENRKSAIDVVNNLLNDGFVGEQKLYFRKYEKLKKLLDGLCGLSVTEEYRCFILDGQILTKAFYWSSHIDDIHEVYGKNSTDSNSVPDDFLEKVIEKVGKNARFYTVDVARKENGEWIVIELNDGQMSGLSCTDPKELYQKIKNHFK